MSIVLWTLQVLLAAVFAAHGWMLVAPPPDLLAIMNEQLGVGFRLFLGVAEILGAIGPIAPAITRMLPWVTPLSAACLAGVVASATVLHLWRGEISSAGIAAILFFMATFLAYGRWRVRPIPPRGRAEARANAVISRAE
jgi:uncharacterized membrane protein YphA (DoxX/SURF4 family)